jgi:hypothetical protein
MSPSSLLEYIFIDSWFIILSSAKTKDLAANVRGFKMEGLALEVNDLLLTVYQIYTFFFLNIVY